MIRTSFYSFSLLTQLTSFILLLILFSFFVLCTSQPLIFQHNPIFNINLGSSIGSQAIALDIDQNQSIIVVAYFNNSIYGYNLQGETILSFNTNFTNNGNIDTIDLYTDAGILVTGGNGQIYLFNTNGLLLHSLVLSNYSYIQEIIKCPPSGGNYFAVVYNTIIEEYKISTTGITLTQTYNILPANQTQFLFSMYSNNHEYLFTTTAVGQMIAYNCSTGAVVGQPLTTTDNSNFKSLSLGVSNSYYVLDYLGLLYSFTMNSQGLGPHSTFLGNISANFNFGALISCPSANLLLLLNVVMSNNSYVTNVLNSSLNIIETLSYFTGQVGIAQCSDNYFVSLDINNKLALNRIVVPQNNDEQFLNTKFGKWILWVIVGCGVFVIIVVILVCCMCCKRRRRRMLQELIGKDSFGNDEANIYEPEYYQKDNNKDKRKVSQLQEVDKRENYRQKENGNVYEINRTMHD